MLDNDESSTYTNYRRELTAIEKLRKKHKLLLRNRKKEVNNSLIYAFYNSPKEFFSQYNISLKFSSYFDICGNSIFMHYFYILYKDHCFIKNISSKNVLSKNLISENTNEYQNNFIKFFQEHKNNLLFLDICKETPLHKIAKFQDKTFFLKIMQQLHNSGILNDELIKVQNIEDKTCCDYIFEEIKYKYEYLILNKKNEKAYSLYKNFVLLIKQKYYLSIFEPLSTEIKKLLNDFIFKKTYDLIKKPIFENIFLNIENLLKNEKEINVVSEYIYDPFNSVINYLNILFHLCKESNDYNKLLHLVKIVESKKEIKTLQFNKIEKKVSLSEICIYDHMDYIFRNIGSSKGRRKDEIKYCNQIIEIIFKNIIKDKKVEELINIIKFGEIYFDEKNRYPGKSFINSLIFNSYLKFEDKIEIISKLNEVTEGLAELEISEIFSIYFFYKDSIQSNNDIITNNIDKIFKDFKDICNIYEYLMDLFEQEKNSLEKYIKLFDNFLLQNNLCQIQIYKMNYNLSITQTKTILEKIKLYVKRKYENIQEKKIKKNNKDGDDYYCPFIKIYKKDIEKKIKLDFILCDKDLCEVILSDIFQRENNNDEEEILALKILFSFKYDFSNFIDKNNEKIKNWINNNNNEITDYLLSLDILGNDSNIDLQYKIISRLIKFGIFLNINEDKDHIRKYFFKLKSFKKNNLLKLSFILNKDYIYEKKLSSLESFSHSVVKCLVTKWDKPLKSFYITNNVINNIEYYCILIIDNLQIFVEQKNAISFFFEEFILLLNPEIKDKLKYYKKICYEYMNKINSLIKEKEEKKNKKKRSGNYFFLMMVFIHIKIKYGDYNPVILFNISKHFDCCKEIFMSYVDCLHENLTKKEIIDHFLLSKAYSHQDLDLNKNYASYNFYKLRQLNHSFIFNSGLNIIPQIKLHLIPENKKEYINSIIEDIISKKVSFLDFLVEDYRTITEAQLKSALYILKSISKKCYIKYKEKYDDSNYKFISIYPLCVWSFLEVNYYSEKWKIIKIIKNTDQLNIFTNLYKLFKVLKTLNMTLYDCIKDNFFFMGETASLFLDILENNEPIKNMEDKIDFINNEMYKFLFSFYNLYKVKEETKNVKLKSCAKRFFVIIWKYFYNKLQLLNNKDQILLEYNFMIEVINFLNEKKLDPKFEQKAQISDYQENYESNNFIEIEFLPYFYKFIIIYSSIFDKNNISIHSSEDDQIHSFFYKNRNKIMDLIVEKIPDKFIEASTILTNYFKKYNFIYEVNLLKRKNSEFFIHYLLNAFSILKSNERRNGFNYYNSFLIKNIINSVNNIQNISKEINLNENDIFIDKSDSIKLLNYSFSNEKMNSLIMKICDLYCEGKNDILFLKILEEYITNNYVFNYLINSLSEAQIKEIFQNNKKTIIKAIYRYTEINKYNFIQILLNNLKLSFDDKFITNLIFPPENKAEFNEMVNFFKNEQIIYEKEIEDYITENEEDNKAIDKKDSKEDKKDNEEDIKDNEEDNEEDNKNFFLFNYSLSYNASKNYEASSILYKYSPSSIRKLNFCKEIYFSLIQIIASRKIPSIFSDSIGRGNSRYNYRRNSKIKLKKNTKKYSEKLLNFIQDSKNEAKINELNPSYYELNKLVESVSKKILEHLDIFNNLDCKIYLFYIIIFIFHKIPYKLKNMICKLELDNYSSFKFNDLIKEDVLEDESSISEYELFIILSLLEIKGDTIISIKEFLPKFYSIIEEKFKKFKDFKIPEMDCRQPNDNKFIEGFKYILNSKPDILIKNLIRTFNFYSFIFILEIKNNTLDNDSNTEFYLEKIIYRLLKFSNIKAEEPTLTISADNTLTLRDFTTHFLSLISPINKNKLELESCKYYLLRIASLCNFILNKFNDDSPYNLSLFHLKIFSENSDNLNELKNKILIQEIKNEIFKRFDSNILNNEIYLKQTFDILVRNWLDDYLKTDHIINEFSNIEKEDSNFIKYIKYLKVNCLILNNFIWRIEHYIKNYFYYKEIKFTLTEEKDTKKARQNLEDSLYNYGIIFKNIIENDEYNNNDKIDIKISYHFNDEINDYVETCTNQQLYFFLNYKLNSCYNIFDKMNYRYEYREYKNELKKIMEVLGNNNINVNEELERHTFIY